jgi:hypothetical protein
MMTENEQKLAKILEAVNETQFIDNTGREADEARDELVQKIIEIMRGKDGQSETI